MNYTPLKFLLFGSAMVSCGLGQTTRTLELSTRGIPLNGEIIFYDQAGNAVNQPIKVGGEKFVWKTIPDGATKFVVKSLDVRSSEQNLSADGNTYAAVNPTQPIDPASLQGAEVKRLPLVQDVRTVNPLPAGESGWVFVGSLSRAAEDSEWNSLYILNASDGEKPDKTEKFTLARLRDRITSGGGQAIFKADFPLILRKQSNSPSGPNLPIVRAGQQFQVLEVAMGGESGKSVMARVIIL